MKQFFNSRNTNSDSPPSPGGNVTLNGPTKNSAFNTGSGSSTVYNHDPADAILITKLTDALLESQQGSQAVQLSVREKDAQIRDLTRTIRDLGTISKGQGTFALKAQGILTNIAQHQKLVDVELATNLASLTADYEQQRIRDDRVAAQLYRGRGALVFATNAHESLSHYKRATELDSEELDGWNQLGHLQSRLGELDDAIASYQKIESLATDVQHRAIAYGNLGNIYRIRGELSTAEGYYRKSLAIEKKLDHREGMASAYGRVIFTKLVVNWIRPVTTGINLGRYFKR